MRNFSNPGRSVTYGMNGAVATSSSHASQVALSILKSGGNAMDAAIAACAVQCVVDPMQTGIGGDCFAIVSPSGDDKLFGLNGSGKAPNALTADKLLDDGIDEISLTSPHAVTVPGAIDAWTRLHEQFASMDFADLLAPAIDCAENGFVVTQRTSVDWLLAKDKLLENEQAAKLFLKDGETPGAGTVWKNPALAETLKRIAKEGRSAFYEGELAEKMVATLNAAGALHEASDFGAASADVVDLIQTEFGGHDVHQIPPSGQGITALLMMNILKGYDMDGLDPVGAKRFHLQAEAARLAYLARDKYVADPAKADVPVEMLLSDEFAAHLRTFIEVGKAGDAGGAGALDKHKDTVYLSVVDKDGMAVSFINSLFHPFGSGIADAEAGVIFQNRGAGFVVDKDHPNCVAPGKRPLHTIIPGMVTKGGKMTHCYGVMGGAYQPVGHAHVLSNIFDFGMDVQEAIEAPRAFYNAGVLEMEETISDGVKQELADMGYEITAPEMPHGGAQMIYVNQETGVLEAGTESRKDGHALAY
ncbi:gamma-glutamyltransferase [Sneathiella sp. P13V-1]|uniref:gamma-glutamyltransferase n=1 Tax=Sneathiella sp. P13V-1 TaxID=2697366 RepID=UPI00187BA721|nr:gamma-glutamyltransferase [Sneathiella sp. P13V-1]MBE7635495.1 gamma-glutamyltransferase [Sneathiella sp. P13V-1]